MTRLLALGFKRSLGLLFTREHTLRQAITLALGGRKHFGSKELFASGERTILRTGIEIKGQGRNWRWSALALWRTLSSREKKRTNTTIVGNIIHSSLPCDEHRVASSPRQPRVINLLPPLSRTLNHLLPQTQTLTLTLTLTTTSQYHPSPTISHNANSENNPPTTGLALKVIPG